MKKMSVYRRQKKSISLNDCMKSKNRKSWAQEKHVATIYSGLKLRVNMNSIWFCNPKTGISWNVIMENYAKHWMTIQSTLKSLSGHTNLWLTDFPYYEHRKKTGKWWYYHKLFLYGSLWCMVWFACHVNLGYLTTVKNWAAFQRLQSDK